MSASLICRAGLLVLVVVTTACSTVSVPGRDEGRAREQAATTSSGAGSSSNAKRAGAYYQDDGPPDRVPPGLLNTPDADPKVEPYLRGPSKPYTLMDQTFVPITDARPYVQRGVGSWYGRKYHGRKTASGEPYDMFAMSAAHPILPIPSYARVTHLRNGRQVIVRINDRGPFIDRALSISLMPQHSSWIWCAAVVQSWRWSAYCLMKLRGCRRPSAPCRCKVRNADQLFPVPLHTACFFLVR
ncbi:MAG: septal ring lytic transglycosylase RlpA family protein [Burkholderiaceae bacterium]